MQIIENFVDQVEEENNYLILLDCYKSFIIDNNDIIRNEGLYNFIECIYKKLTNLLIKKFKKQFI